MRNRSYYAVNTVILILAVPWLYGVLNKIFSGLRVPDSAGYMWLLMGTAFTAATLLTKAVRFYFVVLEKQPGMMRFARQHLKTTLVSLLIPFKAGEFFRIYCFGTLLKNIRTGVFLVLVDRYFDTVPLLVLLIGASAVRSGRVSGLVWFLFLFIALATVAYAVFPATYGYLNRFLIMNIGSEKGIIVLRWLRRMKGWHSYIRELVEGREAVLLLFSCFAWFTEYAALFCLAKWTGSRFTSGDFFTYMNSIFTADISSPGQIYIGISSMLLLASAAFVYGITAFSRERGKHESSLRL